MLLGYSRHEVGHYCRATNSYAMLLARSRISMAFNYSLVPPEGRARFRPSSYFNDAQALQPAWLRHRRCWAGLASHIGGRASGVKIGRRSRQAAHWNQFFSERF
jgi:hypothetical protein